MKSTWEFAVLGFSLAWWLPVLAWLLPVLLSPVEMLCIVVAAALGAASALPQFESPTARAFAMWFAWGVCSMLLAGIVAVGWALKDFKGYC